MITVHPDELGSAALGELTSDINAAKAGPVTLDAPLAIRRFKDAAKSFLASYELPTLTRFNKEA